MTDSVEVKVQELSGLALDWAVAQVEKPSNFVMRDATGEIGRWVIGIAYDAEDPTSWMKESWEPSTDWRCGGPLIQKYQVALVPEAHDGLEGTETSERWYADVYFDGGYQHTTEHCDTPLIAACRAIAATKFGDTVLVPCVLLQ